MRILVVVLLVVIAIVVGGAFLAAPLVKERISGWKGKEQGTEVRMEPAARRTLVQTISAPGEIEPHTKVDISAEVSARIQQLPFREGDDVHEGDLIVKLDDRDLNAALLSAQARRDSEKFRLQSDQARLVGLLSNLEYARKDLERKRQLYGTGDISRSDLDVTEEHERDLNANVEATKLSISVVESTLAAAEADISRAEKGLSNTIILAPIDGIITALNAEIGEVVLLGTMNNPGTVILTIADLDRMLLNAQVAETDIARVAEDQRAKIFINAYPDQEYSGTVRRIALQRLGAADGTGFFKTEIEIDLQGRRIYSGLVANVDIEIASHDGLVVPSQAVVERVVDELPEALRADPLVDVTKKNTFVVYRVADGKAVCTPVETGPSDLTHTLVTAGLDEGETVITGPYKILESIKHDQAVRDIAEAQAEHVADADDTGPAPSDESGLMIIETCKLRKIYRVGVERVHALRGVDLEIERNEMVAIMGSSGSGKSTLMNILGCLDRPTSGRYMLAGRDTSRLNARELAKARNRQIGFVFQSFELLGRQTAMKNVELPLIYASGGWLTRRRRARAALDRVGLSDRVTHRPNQLSGGQKQRVAIARAILDEPAILLADEPTGNLDSATSMEILDIFSALHDGGQTIVIVTHEDHVAARCQRVVRLADGMIHSDLPIAEDAARRGPGAPEPARAAAGSGRDGEGTPC